MKKMLRYAAFGLGAASAAVSTPASAVIPLQLSNAIAGYSLNGALGSVPDFEYTAPFSATNGFTSVDIIGLPQPLVRAQVASGGEGAFGAGFAAIRHEFAFQASSLSEFESYLTSGMQVRFDGMSSIGDSANDAFFTYGLTRILIAAGSIAQAEYACGNNGDFTAGCGDKNFSFVFDVSGFTPNYETLSIGGYVELYAYTENGEDGIQIANSWAMIDPIISLKGPGADTADFRLILPNGIGNGAAVLGAVPESTTWAMIIVGFSLAGATLRRSRRRRGTLVNA